MKKIRVLTMLASSIFILSAIGCSSVTTNTAATKDEPITMIASEDFPNYSSIGDLSERANTIVRGSVIQTRVEALNDMVQAPAVNESALDEELNPGGEDIVPFEKIYTIYTIKVAESFKGIHTAGDTIEVKQLGGQLGNTEIINDDNIKFIPTKDYVLFLETYEDTPASLLNSVQSLYVIKPAAKSTQPGEQQSKSEVVVSANPENDLTLSIEELQEIQNEDQNK
ncbi:MAG TPA: hypothetical protein DEF35_08540 [Paenibacillus sp.]|uniref:hypothetical protein n=1 Tax=Paenibacillus TaxID=44249 RepID=UPI000B9FD840|nr:MULTISPECIES: hypothetical protein [Paenibacillus]OZQ67035.1 hypothetical protein CA599_17650 [Paenibacillus taichungensis]HBU81671.1 hypothetical protein [Paenibacillus sp.]